MEKIPHSPKVILTRTQREWIELAGSGLVVCIAAVLAADPLRSGLGLWFGGLWLFLAWHFKLSAPLMSVLVFVALRGSASSDLPASWFCAVNLGLSAFSLSFRCQNRAAASLVALLWSAVLWISTPLLLVVLAGLPRLSKRFQVERKWFMIPALLSVFSALTFHFLQGSLSRLLHVPAEKETYEALQATFYGVFSVEALWRILPVVGIFEVVQKQPDAHRITWRNLLVFGAVCSLILVPMGPALQIIYIIGIPMSSLLLLRWSYVLPDIMARTVYWLGLGGLLLPFFQGGIR